MTQMEQKVLPQERLIERFSEHAKMIHIIPDKASKDALPELLAARMPEGKHIDASANMAPECKGWCETHMDAWDTKCSYSSLECSTCEACVSDDAKTVSVPECRDWCESHMDAWDKKCGWGSKVCSACGACAAKQDSHEEDETNIDKTDLTSNVTQAEIFSKTMAWKGCKDYVARKGCSWTKNWNCAGQAAGQMGEAEDRGTAGFECCCNRGMWKEFEDRAPKVTQIGEDIPNPLTEDTSRVTQAEIFSKAMATEETSNVAEAEIFSKTLTWKGCKDYMKRKGCSWTKNWNCAGQVAGQMGEAEDRGTAGYECCCRQGMWKESETSNITQALERKHLTRITLEDNSNKDICSACEADMSASWDVKCTYATSCGLCTACNSDKTENDTIENSEEKPEKEDEGDVSAKQDSHDEDETRPRATPLRIPKKSQRRRMQEM